MERDKPNFKDLAALANSPDGQRLLQLAQQSGGDRLSSAVQQAQNGDYEAVKAILSKMLENDEAKRLIQRMRHE